jgi:prophage antirepressor-like protein
MTNGVITFPAPRRTEKAGTNDVTVYTMPDDVGGFAIRVFEINGKPWFVAADVCRALGLDTTKVARIVPAAEKVRHLVPTPGGPQQMVLISEVGLNLLMMRSDKAQAQRFQLWLARDVLPAIRKDGMYVLGEEKVRTGEMSEDEMTLLVLTRLKNKVERITAERDQFANENVQLTARYAVLEHLRGFVTVDAYLAEENHIDGRYKSKQERQIIGQRAAAICRARGIPIQKEHRTMRNKWGVIINTPVNIYPREVIAEACALLGYARRPQILAS